ncbi:acyl-CoA thioesterase [Enhydrobacter aerosaccus]|uniref:Acyl-CoA thioesterase n=1 Tax=Enhydrobacter aerosaccus TaxID=225324 RepID=A0A1T4RY56_9HYPH|nr:hotdog fold thioesterase [Enhydrobacter aerosaccus]SKA20786.1 acyl-CoA thioesterase [Enhydrobacter aerosaccus]
MPTSRPPKVDVAALAARDAFCRDLGIELVEAQLGRAVTRVRIEPRHLNFNGSGHGGLTFTLADAAFGLACNSHGMAAAGVDVHMIYNRAARPGDVLIATAVEISRSASLSHYRIDVARADGKLVAAMTGTAFTSGNPHEIKDDAPHQPS